ncbi:MAG: LEA type 2 family protein [Pseudomonadota bacterium]
MTNGVGVMRNPSRRFQWLVIGVSSVLLQSCASLEGLIQTPSVSLNSIKVTDLDFSGQTFSLGFDVSNPNPFSLPITSINYSVSLDGEHFAGGKTDADLTVPAQGDTEFAISVELDLIRTAPKLLYLIRESRDRGISYRVKGDLGVDVPVVDSVPFDANGIVQVDTGVLGNLRTAFD